MTEDLEKDGRAKSYFDEFADHTPIVPAIHKNTIGIELVYINPGTFMMGTEEPEYMNLSRLHKVEIKVGFWMGRFPVTQGQWYEVMATSIREQRDKHDESMPLLGEGIDFPMYCVCWVEAQDFIGRLNDKNDGFHYALPTEAQWEYAARAGEHWYYWSHYAARDTPYTAVEIKPVGLGTVNRFGLYDMTGNIAEWCQDNFDIDGEPNAVPIDGSAYVDPESDWRVVRRRTESFWEPESLAAAKLLPNHILRHDIGFRVVATPAKEN